jgi:hypothetical protein
MIFGRVVAQRILRESGNRRRIKVSIGEPRLQSDHKVKVWICPFAVEGSRITGVKRATGEDSLQALISAIEGVRATFEESSRQFFWLDPSCGPFIPRYVPVNLGTDFERRAIRAIERETEKRWKAQIKADKVRIRRKAQNLRAKGMNPTQIKVKLSRSRVAIREREVEVKNLKPGWSSLKTT